MNECVFGSPVGLKLVHYIRIIVIGRFDFHFREEGLRRIGVLVIPILIGSSIQQINVIIDRILASRLNEGSIAALNFSNRLSTFIMGLFSVAIGSIFYTTMSKYSSSGQEELFKTMLRYTINILTLLIIPATVGLIVLRTPVVQIVFQRGLFDHSATALTSTALLYFTIGMLGFTLRDALSSAFYSKKDTKTAMINGAIAVALNIVFSILLVPYMGLGGLALGTSLSGIIGTILLMISLHRKIGDYGIRNIVGTFIKVLFSSLFMGVIVYFTYKFIFFAVEIKSVALLASIVTGSLVYGSIVMISKIEEATMLKRIVFSRLRLK